MSTTLDEQDRQKKQAEMIRQYLQITNIDSNPSAASKEPPATLSVRVASSAEPSANKVKTIDIGPLSFDPNEFRKEIEQAEQRVERLRHEVKELQKKRQEQSLRSPPPSSLHFAFPSSIEFDFPLRQFQRPVMSNALPPFTYAHLSFLGRFLPPTTGRVERDRPSLDDRHRQFLWTMQQHREQLLLYLDSLKQALASLDRLASVEPSRNEIHLAHMKLDTIQQKSRQLQALKSTRSAQHSPFIKCRIRHLERDLVQMLSEHQKDVQTKLELNEQRSLMLTKIMQVNDELTALDQQIHQILPNTPVDPHLVNPSSSTTATAPVPEYNVHPLNKLPPTFGN